jgi:hypothetical protein
LRGASPLSLTPLSGQNHPGFITITGPEMDRGKVSTCRQMQTEPRAGRTFAVGTPSVIMKEKGQSGL